MQNELALARHFVAELFSAGYGYARRPEPCVVMDSQSNVLAYREGGMVDGSVAPVYLLNMLLLCGHLRPGSTVVDLGCGPANLLVELAALNPDVRFIGVDLSQEMLRCAAELRAQRGLNNIRFEVDDITQLTRLEPDSADLVMSTLSLHHLPERQMLQQCALSVRRTVRPTGAVHLMDFGGLKRATTTEYFARERARGLSAFLADDYRNSLFAAYRLEDFQPLQAVIGRKLPGTRLHQTFGVPFMMAVSTLGAARPPRVAQRAALRRYWHQMAPPQKADFNALRVFFALDGLGVEHPGRYAGPTT